MSQPIPHARAGHIVFAAALFTFVLLVAASQPAAWATGTPPTVEFITAPAPADRELVVSFSLPTSEPAVVELMDLSGRIVARRGVDAKAGNHVVNLRDVRTLAPGMYLLRLSQAGRSVVRKACVFR